ncbi:MAG: FAD-dependent oxidoreductase, partial [Opitutaceae bacterium]
QLYREIEAMSGQDVGLHAVGGINTAATPERWDMLKNEAARHKAMGIESHLVSPSEIEAMCPIYDSSEILGGLYDPHEGYLDPHGATVAYAQCAKQLGATVKEGVKVEALTQLPNGTWEIETDSGQIRAEHVVNAAGLWAREVGAMAGVSLPLIPMEHHYIITDPLPELEQADKEIPFLIDLDGGIYLRQEHKGVLLGVYEQASKPWALDGTPWTYGETDLLQPRLEDLTPELETGFRRFKPLERVGLRRIVNGPFTFSPDGNPLVGPVPGTRNYWAACGVMAGFAQGGGVGLALAQWMTSGFAEGDIFAMDIARYGPYCSASYVRERVEEFYRRRFRIAFPNEVWPAARPLKTSPLYSDTTAQGANYGCSFGLEQPGWFAGSGEDPTEHYSFRRTNAHPYIGAECLAARDAVGVWDAAAFGKYEIAGAGAHDWLSWLLVCKIPAPGRVALAPMLREDGKLMGDLTLMCLAPDRYWLVGSYYLQSWHMRWFQNHLPQHGVSIRNVSDETAALVLAGPRSRDLLTALGGDPSLSFLSVAAMDIATAPATVARVSLSGELGFEVHAEAPYISSIYSAAKDLGAQFGIRDIGFRSMLSMRLEKGFGIWSREFSPDYTAAMSGLDRFVDFDKGDFLGREAALAERDTRPRRSLKLLHVDATDSDANGFEPIWRDDHLVGFVTSGGYGHRTGKSLALGYVDTEMEATEPLFIDLLGEKRSAQILPEPPYDPSDERMRG